MSNLLFYKKAFQLTDYTLFYDQIVELSGIIEKARIEMNDNFYRSPDLEYIEIYNNLYFYELTYLVDETDLVKKQSIIPKFDADLTVLLTQLLSYLPSTKNCETLENLEIEFPDQNNGLAGLDFTNFEDKNRCVWHEDSWYNFHYQYFIRKPQNRYFIERQKELQGEKFNEYFPNLEYSHKSLYFNGNDQERTITRIIEGKTVIQTIKEIDKKIGIWAIFYGRNRNREQDFLYKEIFGYDEKVALFLKWAKIIAEGNFYVLDEDLSAYNHKRNEKSTKTTPFQIFRSGIGENTVYLSTDTTLGAFEVCNYKGEHQGEYLFSGKYNKGSKKEDGSHDIVLP